MKIGARIVSYSRKIGRKPLALVTGGSSGLGLQYASKLAEYGCNLLIVSNQENELSRISADLHQRFGVEVSFLFLDLAKESAAGDLYGFCQDRGLEVDILINDAGFFFFKELAQEDVAKAKSMLFLHTTTPTLLCILFGNEMKKRGHGFIINMSSMASQLPVPGITVYSATKAYLKSFSKSLYFEMRPYGVGVTTVCPGAIATPLYRLKSSLMDLGVKLGFIGTPEWLVGRALKGMFLRRRVVKPGFMNFFLPPLIAILPNHTVARLWRKFK